MNTNAVSRRRFLAHAGALAAFPVIIPATAIGKGGRPAPSERLNFGFIGYGTMAHDNMDNFLHDPRVQVVSIGDPNKGSGLYGYNSERQGGREPGRDRVNKHYAGKTGKADYAACNAYADFREQLSRDDLNGVVISTPDHWHAIQTIWAARKGLHIYGQKPLSLCVAQGRAMSDAVAKAGVTFQVGSQQRSDVYFRMACEFVRNGRLGKLQRIEVGLPGGHSTVGRKGELLAKTPLASPPAHLDFDLWLGPARQRPFIPAIHHPFTWRWNLDYSAGNLTDWGAHHLDILQWALDQDTSGPVAVENIKADMPPVDEPFNVAPKFSFELVYASGMRVSVSTEHRGGLRFIGEGGKEIWVNRGKIEMTPKDLAREKIQDGEIHLYNSGHHDRNFLDCIYSGKPTITPCETGHRSITLAHLAGIGMRLGKSTLKWDPKAERFVNDAEADALLSRPLRGDWTLDPKV